MFVISGILLHYAGMILILTCFWGVRIISCDLLIWRISNKDLMVVGYSIKGVC